MVDMLDPPVFRFVVGNPTDKKIQPHFLKHISSLANKSPDKAKKIVYLSSVVCGGCVGRLT